ncbi:MAG: hypothetical protein EPO40_25165 [Myxococcaceae bacterium]|nr:MAG: hypothetical protein EPO40_25165 [Myxococcaceae bacterium]
MTPTRAGAAALATALSACGEERVVYDRPDAAPWGARCERPDLPDGGVASVAYVSNSLMNSVSVLDLAAGRTMAAHPVGVGPLAENGPHHLALDRPRGVVYMPLSFPAQAIAAGPHAEHGSAVSPGVFVKRSLCDFSLLGQVDLDPNPGDLALSADGRTAYVSHFDLRRALENASSPEAQRSHLIVIDTATMTRTATVPVCVAAHGLALSPDGRTLYTACYGDDALGVVSLDGPRPTVRLVYIAGRPPGSTTNPRYGPYALSVAPDGSTVWMGCTVATPPLLAAYNVTADAMDTASSSRTLFGKPYFAGFSPDGSTMIVPTQGRDSVVRLTTRAPVTVLQQVTFPPEQCSLPHQVAYGPDGLYYLVCEGRHGSDPSTNRPGTVLALRPDDLSVVRTFTVGMFPDAIVFGGSAP